MNVDSAVAPGTDAVGDPADGESRDLFAMYRGYCARKGVCQFLVFVHKSNISRVEV